MPSIRPGFAHWISAWLEGFREGAVRRHIDTLESHERGEGDGLAIFARRLELHRCECGSGGVVRDWVVLKE